MLNKQIIEFELRGPRPSGHACTHTKGYFHDKTKGKSLSELLLAAKILQKAMYLASLDQGQRAKSLTKINSQKVRF